MKPRTVGALCITTLGVVLFAVGSLEYGYSQIPLWLASMGLEVGPFLVVGGIFLFYRLPHRGRAIAAYLLTASGTWALSIVVLFIVSLFYLKDAGLDPTMQQGSAGGGAGGVLLTFLVIGLPLFFLGLVMFRSLRHTPEHESGFQST
jgi:hypothetical protein